MGRLEARLLQMAITMTFSLMLLMSSLLGTVSAAGSQLALQHAEAIHSSSASILSQLQANPSAEDIPALQQQLQMQMAQLQQLSGVLQQQQVKEQQLSPLSMLQTSEKKSEKDVAATEMWIHATRAYADWVVVWACWVWLSTTPAELILARTSDTVEKFRLTYKKTTVMGIVWGLMLFNWGGFQAELFEMYLIRREAEHAAHAAHGTTNLHAEGGHAEEHGEHGKEHKEEHGKEHKEEHKQQAHKQQEHKQQEHNEKHASSLQLANEPAHGAKGGEEKLAVFAKLDLGIRPWNWAAQYFEHVAVNLEFSWISAKLTISLARVAAAHKTKDKHLIEHAIDEAVEDWIESSRSGVCRWLCILKVRCTATMISRPWRKLELRPSRTPLHMAMLLSTDHLSTSSRSVGPSSLWRPSSRRLAPSQQEPRRSIKALDGHAQQHTDTVDSMRFSLV